MTRTLLLTTVLLLTACASTSTPAAGPPPYTVTRDQTRGPQRYLDADVRAVFDAVAAGLTDDGGYLIAINCATGGTAGADNRLANGRKAVGAKGAAATGLGAGEVQFEPVAGRSCPA